MINPNDPAFPRPYSDNTNDKEVGYGVGLIKEKAYAGLSIRAELAARAMQGILSNLQDWNEEEANGRNTVAEWSVKYADALMNELNKQP